jgi:hypothetical protein
VFDINKDGTEMVQVGTKAFGRKQLHGFGTNGFGADVASALFLWCRPCCGADIALFQLHSQ